MTGETVPMEKVEFMVNSTVKRLHEVADLLSTGHSEYAAFKLGLTVADIANWFELTRREYCSPEEGSE